MRRNKRIQIIGLPFEPPEEVRIVVTQPIPVEMPMPYEPAVPEPRQQPLEKPVEAPKK